MSEIDPICKRSSHTIQVLLLQILLAIPAWAGTITLTADQRGWVGTVFGFPNDSNGSDPGNNYASGSIDGFVLRDWFGFSIPSFGGLSVVSATLNLDQPGPPNFGHFGGTTLFTLFSLGAPPTVTGEVGAGTIYGNISLDSSTNGTTVHIMLDAPGLSDISNAQAAEFFLGGLDSGENSAPLRAANFVNSGAPSGSFKTTLTVVTTDTPEPSSRGLILSGVTLLLLLRPRSHRFKR